MASFDGYRCRFISMCTNVFCLSPDNRYNFIFVIGNLFYFIVEFLQKKPCNRLPWTKQLFRIIESVSAHINTIKRTPSSFFFQIYSSIFLIIQLNRSESHVWSLSLPSDWMRIYFHSVEIWKETAFSEQILSRVSVKKCDEKNRFHALNVYIYHFYSKEQKFCLHIRIVFFM